MYGTKIKMIRELRGFSQEHMAGKLGIPQNSYFRIETNQTKPTAELLDKVAKELGVSPVDILSHEPAFVNFGTVENSSIQGKIENFNNFQKEFFEKMVASKDAEIQRLHQLVGNLLKDKEKLMDFWGSSAGRKP